MAVPTLLREIALLPALAPRLPLPVPVPQLVGRPTDAYPWPFWGARVVPGVELAESGLRDDQRSLALVTCDIDDSLYVSLDEATKMADVEVVYAHSF